MNTSRLSVRRGIRWTDALGRANSYLAGPASKAAAYLWSRASITRSKPALCRVVAILGGTSDDHHRCVSRPNQDDGSRRDGELVIHVYAGEPARGPDGRVPVGTGAIDHVSLTAARWDEFRSRFDSQGFDWRESVVVGTTYWQLFVHDPNGVLLELTFDGRGENRPTPIPPARQYVPGKSFFRPSSD
jgi:catechol 2,3-dioxygenase-like lactoylglutathione lyase family enzyme